MAIIRFQCHKITDTFPGGVGIVITGHDPFPPREIEAGNVPTIEAHYQNYVDDARRSGKPLQCSARVRSGRAPSGFNKRKWEVNVNLEKVDD